MSTATCTETPAVYGVVAHSGQAWSVEFKREGNNTRSLSGHGEFPSDRYPGIPVLRFDRADLEDVQRWLAGPVRHVDVCSQPHEMYPEYSYTIGEYLDIAKSFGIPTDYRDLPINFTPDCVCGRPERRRSAADLIAINGVRYCYCGGCAAWRHARRNPSADGAQRKRR